MAIISEINATIPKTAGTNNLLELPKIIYFGVFFDGTSNNMIQGNIAKEIRKRYKNKKNDSIPNIKENDASVVASNKNRENTKYSNIAILHSYYKGIDIEKANKSKKTLAYKIYIEGSGANDNIETENGKPIVGLGFGLGKTGVIALVSKAVKAIKNILCVYNEGQRRDIELKFDVFGFSRGAACARLFSYLIARTSSTEEKVSFDEKLPSNRENEFKAYLPADHFGKDGKLIFIDQKEWKDKKVEIDFLGIFDTVVSIGFLRRTILDKKNKQEERKDKVHKLKIVFSANDDFNDNYHDLNVTEYGMYSPQMTKTIKHCLHIGAMDEFRENFAFTDIGEKIPAQSLELLIPGCHSDIGGGYIDNDVSIMNFHNHNDLFYYETNPQSKKNSKKVKISKPLMVKMGWGLENEIKTTWNDSLQIKRYIPKNYCALPLRVMIDRVKADVKERGEEMFNLNNSVYKIPSGLSEFKKGIDEIIKDKHGQRICIFPEGGYSGEYYKKLRLNYLHFTSSDTVGVKLVNGANKIEHNENNIVCRIVYHGDKDDSEMHYMSDYNINAIEVSKIT